MEELTNQERRLIAYYRRCAPAYKELVMWAADNYKDRPDPNGDPAPRFSIVASVESEVEKV